MRSPARASPLGTSPAGSPGMRYGEGRRPGQGIAPAHPGVRVCSPRGRMKSKIAGLAGFVLGVSACVYVVETQKPSPPPGPIAAVSSATPPTGTTPTGTTPTGTTPTGAG